MTTSLDYLTSADEYTDALRYDQEYGAFEPAGSFYSGLAAETGGPILELACGTGRVAIPLARQGYDVTGVDMSDTMLARARFKSAGESIQWVQADCRDLQIQNKFRLIFLTGNSFQAFLTRDDQEALFSCIRKHLQPGGLFAFDTRYPNLNELLAEQDEEEFWHSYTDANGHNVSVSGILKYDALKQIGRYITFRRWQEHEQEIIKPSHIDLRYVFPQEMDTLLHYNGFTILRKYGNWDLSPLTAESSSMIYVCKVK